MGSRKCNDGLIIQSHTVEIHGQLIVFRAVNLVYGQVNRLFGLAQDLGHVLITGENTLPSIDHEDDPIRLLNCPDHLAPHLAHEGFDI